MKLPSLSLSLLLALVAGRLAAQSSFLVAPKLALQTSVPGREGYEYQIESSPTPGGNWSPLTDRRVSTGGVETFSFAISNQPAAFFRGMEFPPDLSRRVQGLRSVYFDNASLRAFEGTVFAHGVRLVSQAYNTNDFVSLGFGFDLAKQTLGITSLTVRTNIGPSCGQDPVFFLKDVPAELTIQVNGQALNDYTAYTLSASGQDMAMNVVAGQVLSLIVNPVAENVRFEIRDSSGTVVASSALTSNGITTFLGPYNVYESGAVTLRFSPDRGVTPVRFSFANCNYYPLKTLTKGQTISSSISGYLYDYDKFQVRLLTGQTLQMNNTGDDGAYLQIHNSRGVSLFRSKSTGSGFFRFTASTEDTYYVIFSHDDFQGHRYTSTVSITP